MAEPLENHLLNLALPPGVVRALQALAQKYKAYGLDIFVFGSFARGEAYPTSDLDLGVEWRDSPDPDVFRRLYQDVQNLPTIRPVELVDFAQTDAKFREQALQEGIPLWTE